MRRRAATALGIYGSATLGVLATVVALRVLGTVDAGRFALVIATVALFQLLLDVTSEEALVKYGFRYSAREDWGRFRRLFRVALEVKAAGAVAASLLILAVVPFAGPAWDVTTPLLIAALIPLLWVVEGVAAAALVLRSRYDVRAWFLLFSSALRFAGIAIGTQYGVTGAVVGVVVAQALGTLAIGAVGLVALARFPSADVRALGDDRREIVRFVVQSSLGTGIVSLRGWIAPLLVGVVASLHQVGLFRAAQAPQQGFAALSSPVRLILLTEQTRDWERGKPDVVLAGLRRYIVGSAALMAVTLVPFWLAMPWLVRTILGEEYVPATDAARLILLAAAVQLVFGWTKSLPVSIGRPNLRVLAHGIETAVLVPLIVAFAAKWGATGAAAAVLVSTLVFAAVWTVLLMRIRAQPLPQVAAA